MGSNWLIMDVSEKYSAFSSKHEAKFIYNVRTLFGITNRIRQKIHLHFHAVDGVAKGRYRKIKTSYFITPQNYVNSTDVSLCKDVC